MQGHATEHEWETSPWPLVLSFGVLFLAPFAFALYFVYDKPVLSVVSLGIGVPLVVLSIAGWIKESAWRSQLHRHLEEVEVGYGLDAMPFFIIAEAFIFVSFFAAYWVTRLSTNPVWPPLGTPEMPVMVPIIMTIILVASSITIHTAENRVHHGDRSGFLFWLVITMILGAAFLGLSINEWTELFHEGFNFKTNIYSTAFFTITGFHGSHVFVGLGMFLCALLPALMGKVNKTYVRAVGLYWHFVDVVWFFVVSQIYFW